MMLSENAIEKPTLRSTREAFGDALIMAAKRDAKIVALCADLEESTYLSSFKKAFPERFFEFGVAEQNMVGAAAGMSLAGTIPFVASFGAFVPFRTLDQIRVNLGYSRCNVKLCSTHCGLLTGEDGATHQPLEDIAVMRVIPNMTVVVPSDAISAAKAIDAVSRRDGPCYVRLSRAKIPVIYSDDAPFEIGKINVLREGKDVVIISCGSLVHPSLVAAKNLESSGIRACVIDSHTIKPLDKAGILSAVKGVGAVVVAEEHQAIGGLGGAVAEVLSLHYPCAMVQVAIQDQFGESGKAEDLLKKYGLTSSRIEEACRAVMKRKAGDF